MTKLITSWQSQLPCVSEETRWRSSRRVSSEDWLVTPRQEAIRDESKRIDLARWLFLTFPSIMAALEWDADLYLPSVAHQAQANPGSKILVLAAASNDRTDPRCRRKRRRSSETPFRRGTRWCFVYRWNRVNETCHWRPRNNVRERQGSKLEKFPG